MHLGYILPSSWLLPCFGLYCRNITHLERSRSILDLDWSSSWIRAASHCLRAANTSCGSQASHAGRKSYLETSSASRAYISRSLGFWGVLSSTLSCIHPHLETGEEAQHLTFGCSLEISRETIAPRPPARTESRSRVFGFYFTMNSILFSLFLLFDIMDE